MKHFLIGQNFCEWDYFNVIIDLLDVANQRLRYVVTENLDSLPTYGRDVVVFVTSDESYKIPKYCNLVRAVFKNYVTKQVDNLYAIPLGYTTGFKGDSSMPVSVRPHDVWFSGQKTRDRIDLNRVINTLRCKATSRLTDRFRTGFTIDEYSQYLATTKIAPVPEGRIGPESFRYFEAAAAGCVIITKAKPSNDVYYGSPAIVIKSWNDLVPVVNELLACPSKMADLQKAVIDHYETNWSPSAVAKYVLARL